MSLISKGLRFASKLVPMDGNAAAAHVAYNMSEASFLYPITPSTPMGDQYDQWSSQGKKNVFGHVPQVRVLQSEAGAVGALHGAAAVGTFTTTFTASQGLLLMIPNMLKTAGELWPTVFHVASRAVSTQALSIQGDHADIMCVKNTGFAFLASSTVQEIMDLAAVAHMSTIDSEIPFVHFFEGFKLSHQIDSIEKLTFEQMKELMPFKKLEEIRRRSLNPAHPFALGHSQGPDAFFQTCELLNSYYDRIPQIVQANMDKVGKLTGRHYKLFDYYGHPEAEDVIVVMGHVAPVIKETINLMKNEKVGLVIPHLYRPWSMEDFIKALPRTTKRISVLDRSKDPAAEAEPLFLDVAFTCKQLNFPATVTGGRYGLASREFTPLHAKAVFDNMRSEHPKMRFTVGINDDVTHLSLPAAKLPGFGPQEGTIEAIFWGLGGDGTIGANKSAIKTAIDVMGLHAQGNFSYSADKSNSLTRSFLRFSNKPITSQYTIMQAQFVGCTLPAYVTKYPMADKLTENGTFFINCPWDTVEKFEKNVPAKLRQQLAKKKAKLFVCDATNVAEEVGLHGKISTIIQACFYQLSGLLGDDWLKHTDEWIDKEFTRLGSKVVQMNKTAAREGVKALKQLEIPTSWENAVDAPGSFKSKTQISFMGPTHEKPEVISKVIEPCVATAGANLPVSAFQVCNGGISPFGTCSWLKKGLSPKIPVWDESKCIQCNMCSITCPHSVIRPYLLSQEEVRNIPEPIRDLKTIPAKGKEFKGYNFRIECSPYDCVGCELCVGQCPTKAITMQEIRSDKGEELATHHNDMFIYLNDCVENHGDLVKDRFTIRGSQFQRPMIEFPGSCEGCNETMVTKILTQLFGPRMIIANPSGCSSVWGGAFPRIPFTVDKNGRGPAWARSLFEDNAEYGFGMTLGMELRRNNFKNDIEQFLANPENTRKITPKLVELLKKWLEIWQDGDATLALEQTLLKEIEANKSSNIELLENGRDLWVKPSHWIIGGDGWAYDIGFGGVDHIFAQNKNFNILIFDNETYSNTGGQQSKATNIGAVAQFASAGKDTPKKDIGFMMMNYGNVYVAQCAFGNQKHFNHLLRCLKEAESFNGPSLIICYCNCILHHIKGALGAGGNGGILAQQLAVDSGYWPLYSYDPRREAQGKNPLKMESGVPDENKLDQFLDMEVRYNSLKRINPAKATEYRQKLHQQVVRRYKKYVNFAKVFD